MFLLILMNILWGASYTVLKWGISYCAPMHLLFFRLVLSAIILSIFSYGHFVKMPRGDFLRCVALGAIIAAAHSLGVIGIEKSHATDGAILYALEPVLAIVFARILLKEKMTVWGLVSLLLALAGFLILSNVTAGGILSNMTLIGNAIMLMGIFADGLFSPVAKPVVKKYPARIVLTVAISLTTLFVAPLALLTPLAPRTFSMPTLVSVLYLSVICTCVGWTMWLFFLKRFPVNVIALTVFIQPIVGPFVSHFTIGEQIGARIWFGGGIILIGVLIAVFKRKNSETEMIAEAVIH